MDNNTSNNNLFVDDSLNNFGKEPDTNVVNNTETLQPNTNVVNSAETLQSSASTVNKEIPQTSAEKTIFDNDVTEPQLTPIEPQTNDAELKPNVTESTPSVDKPKKSKGTVVVIILLILLVLGLGGYIVYDKFIAVEDGKKKSENQTNSKDETTKDDSIIEYISLDSKEYLKLNTNDNTYKLSLNTNESYDKTGSYIENNETYLLGDYIKAEVKGNYIEISEIKRENYVFYNYVLFKKDKIEDVKSKITSSITEYVNNIGKDSETGLEIESVKLGSANECYRYAMTESDVNGNIAQHVSCGISYNIYFKNYEYNSCLNEDSQSNKYMNYMIPSGSCENDYVSNGFYALFDESDNYKILYTYTGM